MLSPSLVRYAPSPQVGFSVHPGKVTNGTVLAPLALLCVASHSYSVSFVLEGQSLPKMFAGRVRVGTHDVHDVQFFF